MTQVLAPRGAPPKDPFKLAEYNKRKLAYEQFKQTGVIGASVVKEPEVVEDDATVLGRFVRRFDIMRDVAGACIRGIDSFRSVVVTGPGGVGKTEEIMGRVYSEVAAAEIIEENQIIVELVKSHLTPFELYKLLYNMKEKNCVIVFDDVDAIFKNPDCFRLLKAALDTGDKKQVDWRSSSALLAQEDIPKSFNYEGSIIAITNMPLQQIADTGGSESSEHLRALLTRVFLMDLKLHSTRDLTLWTRFMVEKHNILVKRDNLTPEQQTLVLEYMAKNRDKLKSINIRVARNIAGLMVMYGNEWSDYADEMMLR